jgi:hypothetical protein
MNTMEHSQARGSSARTDAPRPLSITKHIAQRERSVNHESEVSDGKAPLAMDSSPAHPGGNRSLTMPKRGDRDTERCRKRGSRDTEDARSRTGTLSPSHASEGDARTLHAPRSPETGSPIGSFSLPEPLVLTPRIIVTPEYRAVDESVSTLWAAVQLSTQVCLPNTGQARHSRDSEESEDRTTGHSQETSSSG